MSTIELNGIARDLMEVRAMINTNFRLKHLI